MFTRSIRITPPSWVSRVIVTIRVKLVPATERGHAYDWLVAFALVRSARYSFFFCRWKSRVYGNAFGDIRADTVVKWMNGSCVVVRGMRASRASIGYEPYGIQFAPISIYRVTEDRRSFSRTLVPLTCPTFVDSKRNFVRFVNGAWPSGPGACFIRAKTQL